MFASNRKRFIGVTLCASFVGLAASAALASAMSNAVDYDDDENSPKDVACSAIGCPNGSRVCGTLGGTIKAGVPPFVGEVNVTFTCYEAPVK